jgi:uncharacterized protein (DUF433 family)
MIEPLIVVDPEIRQGKPAIAGTPILVTDVLGWLAEGHTIKQITKDHPALSEVAVTAAIRYALTIVDAEQDAAILRAAAEALVQMGYAQDTENLLPGAHAEEPWTAVGFMGRVTPK